MKKFKTKIILYFLLLLSLFFFSSDFTLIDIQKTAIIAAIGIDIENEKYLVTAQIAVPQATDTASANNDAVISGTGNTVIEAIDEIGIKTGWTPKLSFCNLILLGNSVIEKNVINIVDYLVSTTKIQNSAIIAGCEKKASDLLYSQTPLDAISAFALQKILLRNPLKVNTVCETNLRQFAIAYYSPSNGGYMPIIKEEKTEDKSKDNSSDAQTTNNLENNINITFLLNEHILAASSSSDGSSSSGSSSGDSSSGGSSSSSGGGEENKSVIFDATTTAVFKNGAVATTLERDETLFLGLLTRPVEESFIAVEIDDEKLLLAIENNANEINIKFKEKPEIHIKLDLYVKIEDSSKQGLLEKMPHKAQVPDYILSSCKQKVEKTILNMFDKIKTADADLFEIKNKLYKYYNSKFEDYVKIPMSNYEIITEIQVKSID